MLMQKLMCTTKLLCGRRQKRRAAAAGAPAGEEPAVDVSVKRLLAHEVTYVSGLQLVASTGSSVMCVRDKGLSPCRQPC